VHDFSVGLLGDCSLFIVARYYDDISIAVTEFCEHTNKVGVLEQNVVTLCNEIISPALVLRANFGTCD
jgi:hypothetical protein